MDWGTLGAEAFRQALSGGLGRALLHVRQTERVPDEEALWQACITCQTFDWDLEGHRAPWLWTLLHDAGLATRWAEPLLASLPEATTIPDADQRAGLALCLARTGHNGATAALRALLSRDLDPTQTIPGARELIELEGIDGLHAVLRTAGRALRAGDHRHLDGLGTWMMAAEDILGVEAVARELERSDPDIRAVQEAWMDEPSDLPDPPAAPALAPEPLTPPEREHLYTAVHAAALALASGQSPRLDADALARGLARLTRHPPRFLDPLLLTLDGHPDPRVQRQVSRLLSGIRDPLLRAWALEGPIGHPNRLRYLVANFESGDAHRIRPALTLSLATDAAHDRCAILLRLHEAHPDEDWAGCLLHVYARGPSSLQREEALERLVDDAAAPPWLLAEACWDAHPAVAQAAREAESS